MVNILVICGPTASGKSEIALTIAKNIDGEIVNFDSVQFYKGIDILSAQPSDEEFNLVKHHFYKIKEPEEHYTAGDFANDAAEKLREIINNGKKPILVGGTGLYLKALTEGTTKIPAISKEIRDEVENLFQVHQEKFHDLLKEIDPVMAAKLNKNDKQRIKRAYEVMLVTGKSFDYWQKTKYKNNDFEFKFIKLLPEREWLYNRINKRFDNMIDKGVIEEVNNLYQSLDNKNVTITKSSGFPEIISFLNGEIEKEEAMSKAKQSTRNYAKRQYTWFRNQVKGIDLIYDDLKKAVESIQNFL